MFQIILIIFNMGKVIVHEFDPQVYPRKLWVCFNATREVLEKYFNFEREIKEEWFTDGGAITSNCTSKETDLGGYLVWTGLSKIPVDYISHEASHVADNIFEYIGENSKTEECYAYLIGWVAKHIDIAMRTKTIK